jgi:hypothetical protein
MPLLPLSHRDFDRDGDDEVGKFEVKVSQIIKDKKVIVLCCTLTIHLGRL